MTELIVLDLIIDRMFEMGKFSNIIHGSNKINESHTY